MKAFDYDLIVIGGGPAGLVASKTAAGMGKKVALIEKNKLGGECTLTGCIPSKTLISVAKMVHQSKTLKELGLASYKDLKLNITNIMDYVRQKINYIYSTHTPEKLAQLGIDVFIGSPKFIDQYTIAFESSYERPKELKAKKYIISIGTNPFVPPIEGLRGVPLDKINYLTNENLFNLETLPESLIILGGGPIGIEMAGALNRLGVKITVIEMQDRILPKDDKELTDILASKLEDEGVNLNLSTKLEKVEQHQDGIIAKCIDSGAGPKNQNIIEIKSKNILVAVGRIPDFKDLDLDKIGVQTSKKGINVNNQMQTSISNIYACGDIVGPFLFSHMAEYQAVIAVRNAFIPFFKTKADYSNAIWVTFSDPELASLGLNEIQAREKYGDSIKIYRKYYKENDRAVTEENTMGLAKIICDKKGKILGATILGARAGDIISEIQLSKYYHISLPKIYQVIHAYPTYSEVIWQASKRSYIDMLKNNFFLKILRKIFGGMPRSYGK